jgi:ketosteroid isomerase-like protein
MHPAPRALLLVALLLPAAARAQDPAVIQAVLAYQEAATDAFLRNDAEAIDSLLADDFTLTDSRGTVSTRANAVAEARAQAVSYTDFRNVNQRVRLYLDGRVAVVTGRTIVAGSTRDGTTFRQDLPFTDTLILDGGRWRMVASHVSLPPP